MPADPAARRARAARFARSLIVAVAAATAVAGCATDGGPQASAAASAGSTTAGTAATSRASAGSPTSGPTSTTATAVAEPAQLPRGGRRIFPEYRLFGYAGSPGAAAFGRLGVGDIDARVRELERRGAAYADGRRVLPVLELVAVIAHSKPGKDGDFSGRVSDATIRRYLAAARRHKALLLLNIQPGRARFIDLVRQLEPWLRQPDVGVALDPEWAVGKGQVPGRVYGSTTGAELDGVARYLDGLVRRYDLPQKVMVFHQVAASVVRRQSGVTERAGVVVVKSVDGIGSRAQKVATWTKLVHRLPDSIHPGFKLFFDEDARHGRLMTPAQVLALRPQPEYVLFE
jgi:hypothetical protein